jgi:hypothetical protein
LTAIQNNNKPDDDKNRLGTEWQQYAGWDLIEDWDTLAPYCTLEQFLVGRASFWAAGLGSDRALWFFSSWRRYREPGYFDNPVYLAKPGAQAFVDKERAKRPPEPALATYSAFIEWLYQSGEPWQEWTLLRPDHHDLAAAAGIWLVDSLGLTPEQVVANRNTHHRAFSLDGLAALANVAMPEKFVMESPGLPVPCVDKSAKDYKVAGYLDWIKSLKYPDEPLALMDMLVVAGSGIGGFKHDSILYPSCKAPE